MFSKKDLQQLIVPLIIEQFLSITIGMADTVMVSVCGEATVSGVSLVDAINILLINIFSALATGGAIVSSQYIGREEPHQACEAAKQLILSVFVLSTAIGALFVFGGPQILGFIYHDVEAAVMQNAEIYFFLTALSYPFIALYNAGAALFRAMGNSRISMVISIVMNCINVGGNALFIFGFDMGAAGAALATLISQLVGGVLPVFYFIDRSNSSRLHLCKTSFYSKVLRDACINGSSELMTNLSMSLVNILYNYQLLRLAGENGVAAYGVIMYAAFLFVAVFVGYAVGSAPIVSFHYGARNHAEVHNLYRKSLRLIAVVAVTLTLASMFIIPCVARIFVGYDAELLALTSRAFRLYALSFLIMGFNVYASSFFTALGDGVTSALISFLRTLAFQVIAILLLPLLLGIDGIWLAVTAAELAALAVSAAMLLTKDKVFHYRKA